MQLLLLNVFLLLYFEEATWMLFECLKLYTSLTINSYFLRSRPKVFRTICWKHGTLIKRCHRCLDNNLHKIFQTNVPENTTFDSYFNGQLMLRQLINLNFKWRVFIKMMSPLLAVRENFTVYPPAEACSGTSQASIVDLFARIVNGFKSTLLTIFVKMRVVTAPLPCSNLGNSLFHNPWVNKSVNVIDYVNIIKMFQVRWCPRIYWNI